VQTRSLDTLLREAGSRSGAAAGDVAGEIDEDASVESQIRAEKEHLKQVAELQKAQHSIHVDQQVRAQELALEQAASMEVLCLRRAAHIQRATLEVQAAALSAAGAARQAEEEFLQNQEALQKGWTDGQAWAPRASPGSKWRLDDVGSGPAVKVGIAIDDANQDDAAVDMVTDVGSSASSSHYSESELELAANGATGALTAAAYHSPSWSVMPAPVAFPRLGQQPLVYMAAPPVVFAGGVAPCLTRNAAFARPLRRSVPSAAALAEVRVIAPPVVACSGAATPLRYSCSASPSSPSQAKRERRLVYKAGAANFEACAWRRQTVPE